MMGKNRFFLFIIVLIGGGIRLYHLKLSPFWCDEFLAISYGWQPLNWMVNYITFNDAHPPLFYTIVHFLLKFGYSEFYLRSLPALFGIFSIPLAFFVGREFKNEKTGLILSLIMALNPAYILWSQILKSYSLFIFFLLLSFYSFIKILKNNENRKIKYMFFLFISDIVLLYLHNFAFIWILIEGSTLIFSKKFRKEWFFYYLLLLISYLPWIVRIPYQLKFTLGVRRPIPLIFKYFYTFFYFFMGETVNPFNFYIVSLAAIVFSILIFKGIIELKTSKREENLIIYHGLFLPLFLVSFPTTVPQNLLPYSIFWLVIISIGISKINYQKVFLFIIIFVFSVSNFFYFTGKVSQFHDVSKLTPYREINKFFVEDLDKKSIIFENERRQFFTDKIFSAFDWYYKGKAKVIEARKEGGIEKVKKIAKNYEKIGLFLNYNEQPEWCEKIKKYFMRNYTLIYQKKFLYNEKLLSRFKGKKEYYWFVEVYIFEKVKK